MLKTFVHRRKDITEQELIDYNSFCQLLPGASSTQTLTLIGYKRGGVLLAALTLIIWILPASFIMGALSFILKKNNVDVKSGPLQFIGAMAIGFLLYAIRRMLRHSVNSDITIVIAVISAVMSFIFFKSPWVFPVLMITGSIITNLSSKRIPKAARVKPREIKWLNILWFLLIYLLAVAFSEMSRKGDWENRRVFNVFESHYRFGSIVFGGGDVLLPMMLDQFVERPKNPKVIARNPNIIRMDREQLLTGFGIVRAIPGPVFSISAYTGGEALAGASASQHLLGCIAGVAGLFLPSALLVLFFFPVWENLKKFVLVYRALEGINAVVAGLMVAGLFYLLQTLFQSGMATHHMVINLLVIAGTMLLLEWNKLPAPVIVSFVLLIGWLA